jgi:hypothetical protein
MLVVWEGGHYKKFEFREGVYHRPAGLGATMEIQTYFDLDTLELSN